MFVINCVSDRMEAWIENMRMNDVSNSFESKAY